MRPFDIFVSANVISRTFIGWMSPSMYTFLSLETGFLIFFLRLSFFISLKVLKSNVLKVCLLGLNVKRIDFLICVVTYFGICKFLKCGLIVLQIARD
jgi:hypothetical protein